MFVSFSTIIKQLLTGKSTNLFPVGRQPLRLDSLKSAKINQPVPAPDRFRGRQKFHFDKCIGCGMCVRVCPAAAIEMYPVTIGEKNSKRIEIFMARCIFCMECVDVCPKNAIEMGDEFLLSNYSKFGDDQVVGRSDKTAYNESVAAMDGPSGQG